MILEYLPLNKVCLELAARVHGDRDTGGLVEGSDEGRRR